MRRIAVFFGGYVVVATAMSYLFETNFHNLLQCNLAPIENIRLAIVESMGWAGQALYIAILFVLTIALAMVAYFAVHGLLILVDKIRKKITEKNA